MLFLFSLAVFLSAALLFFVEPMFARMILPRLGGAPAVWNTCVVLYQSLLFAGYGYAHLAARHLKTRAQIIAQLGLFAAGAALLPIAVGPSWTPPTDANPIGWVFVTLLAIVGMPFFVLAATGPLLQHWFAGVRHRASANPYMLYAASNLGSLLALLAYPLLVEPTLRLHTQSLSWTATYAALIAVIAACGVAVWRASAAAAPEPPPAPPASAAAAARARKAHDKATALEPVDAAAEWWPARLEWVLLALVPSSLMLSVTTFISTDVAAVPLLWMAPLSLYLLTFVLAFAERQWIPAALLERLFPAAVVGVFTLVLAQNVFAVVATVAWHLLCFFVIALRCHQRLSAARPPSAQLTEFYLWISAGGAIGGLFNTLVAPFLFLNALEYPLAAASACVLLRDTGDAGDAGARRGAIVKTSAAVLAPTALLSLLLVALRQLDERVPHAAGTRYLFIFLLPLLASFALRRRPMLMGLALVLLLFQGTFVRFDNRVPVFITRTFYGEQRVMFTGRERLLTSGTTNHGAQSLRRDLACEPLTYYSRLGPVGQIFQAFAKSGAAARIGVIGLGTGSMGAYATPAQTWTFFEINPVVERIARDPDYFTYLRDCAPQATVTLGDARLSLEQVPDAAFDLLFVDAFSSDAIPVHLLTTEAMQLYFHKLAPGGRLAVHISNRYLQLTPVIAGVARAAGLAAAEQVHQPSAEQLSLSEEITTSRWTILARTAADLTPLTADARWHSLSELEGIAWTDDYSNVWMTLR